MSLVIRLPSLRSAVFFVILSGMILRLLFLDADPVSRIWSGYITDEGWWNHNARNAILFRKDFLDIQNLHFFIAPIYQSINYLFFLIFDISRLSARIFPALCGISLIYFFFKFLEKAVSRESLFLGLTLLSFQPDILMLGRISTPEAPIMLLELLIFFLITLPRPTRLTYLFAGLLLLFGIGIKATFLSFVLIFSCVVLADPQNATGPTKLSRGVKLFFLTGFVVLPLLFFAGWILFNRQGVPDIKPIDVIFRFLYFNDLYSILSFPFYNPICPTFNFLALGLWISLIAWLHLKKDSPRRFRLHQLFVTAGIWFIAYLVIMTVLRYFPERYQVHIFVPMIILISIGTSILQDVGFNTLSLSISGKLTFKLFLIKLLYILPTSIFLAIFVKFCVDYIFGLSDRFLYTMICIGFSASIVFCFAVTYGHRKDFIDFLLLFPIVATTAWNFNYYIMDKSSFWIPIQEDTVPTGWIATIIFSCVLTAFFINAISRKISISIALNAFSIAVLLALIAWLWPFYSNPRFTVRDTSIALGKYLKKSDVVGDINATGLFLDNDIEYVGLDFAPRRRRYPEYIVSVFERKLGRDARQYLDGYYKETENYYLNIYPEAYYGSSEIKVIVYRKIKDPE